MMLEWTLQHFSLRYQTLAWRDEGHEFHLGHFEFEKTLRSPNGDEDTQLDAQVWSLEGRSEKEM